MNHHPDQLQLLPVITVTSKYSAAVRRRISRTLKERGIRPRLRWSQRFGLPAPQRLLLELLRLEGLQPVAERVLRVRGTRHPGWPCAYVLDLALEQHRLAIETDGGTHRLVERRRRDRRREHDLTARGWSVVRAENPAVLHHLRVVLQVVRQAIAAQERGDRPGVFAVRLRREQPQVSYTAAPITLRPDQQGRVQVYGPCSGDGDRLQLSLPGLS